MQKYRNRFERMTIPRQKTEIRRPIADLRQIAPIMAVGELAAMERKRKYVIQVADSGTVSYTHLVFFLLGVMLGWNCIAG